MNEINTSHTEAPISEEKKESTKNTNGRTPTTKEIIENTKGFFSQTVAETLEKWGKRYGPPAFQTAIREEIELHAIH